MTSPFERIAAARSEQAPRPRPLRVVHDPPDIPESNAIRPTLLSDVIGQAELVSQLRTHINFSARRDQPPGHAMFVGASGYGKTSLARAIHGELVNRGIDSRLHIVMPAAMTTTDELARQIAQLQENDVLFLDEVHAFKTLVQEGLYNAMEDGYIVTSGDRGAQVVSVPPFTLVAGTTDPDKVLAPLQGRFKFVGYFERYAEEDLAELVQAYAEKSEVKIDDDAALVIAMASWTTPRTAITNLEKVQAYAEELSGMIGAPIDEETARQGLEYNGIDEWGLTARDRHVLRILAVKFEGGPIGLKPFATACGISQRQLEKDIEPRLIDANLIELHGRGRCTTVKSYKPLDLPVPPLLHAWR